MLNKKLLVLSLASTLLATNTFGTSECAGEACMAKLDNLKPVRTFAQTNQVLELENNIIDKAIPIILDNQLTLVFPHSSYVSSEVAAMENDALILTEVVEKVENKILEKSALPSSEYFCAKDKEPIYFTKDIYECV